MKEKVYLCKYHILPILFRVQLTLVFLVFLLVYVIMNIHWVWNVWDDKNFSMYVFFNSDDEWNVQSMDYCIMWDDEIKFVCNWEL